MLDQLPGLFDGDPGQGCGNVQKAPLVKGGHELAPKAGEGINGYPEQQEGDQNRELGPSQHTMDDGSVQADKKTAQGISGFLNNLLRHEAH